MINKERVLERFLNYVQIDSPTKSEADFAKHLMDELKALGLDVTMDQAGEKVGSNAGNLITKIPGTTEGETILFSSHMDTVSPSIGIKPQIKGDTIYSDGTTILASDDKAGVAAIMEALETMLENKIPHGDLEIVFSIYEESGLNGSKNLDYNNIKAKKAFVFDSGGDPGEIVVAGPAQNILDIEFIGKPAHAGVEPENGISAIQMAADAIANMNLLRIDEETTANIGTIKGGEVTNIVTEKVCLLAEARSLSDEKLEAQTQHMIKVCQETAEKFGGKVNIEVTNMYGAFKADVESDIVNNAKKAMEELGLKAETVNSGGGSDTNILSQHGIDAINLGVGMKEPHTLNEHIKIEHLEQSAALVLQLIKVHA